MTKSSSKQGAVLIICVGLASILLLLAVTFLARTRSDARDLNAAVAQAQARLMLHAALMYVQECSRIGWGDATGECFGWTDVRDGGLGPRGPRPAGASGAATAIPAPEWWTQHRGWPAYKPYPNEDTDFPSLDARKGGWPLPGTAVRCPMAVPVRAPYAVESRFCYNPVPTPVAYADPAWSAPWNPKTGNPFAYSGPERTVWPLDWIDRIFDPAQGAKGMLDPQPVADDWRTFAAGALEAGGGGAGDWTAEPVDSDGVQQPGAVRLAVRPGTENQAWFRIYRELQADHDDVDQPDDHVWWDKVALFDKTDTSVAKYNWSCFIIACGAGGTRGYRFWDDDEISAWETKHGFRHGLGRCLEPVTAQESGLFVDADSFHSLLRSSQILWFRCEWSALQSGARNSAVYNDPVWRADGTIANPPAAVYWWPHVSYDLNAQYANTWISITSDADCADTRSISTKTYGGNVRWLQRLDRDPLKW